MIAANLATFDPKLDLSFERLVDVPRELVWAAWTNPQHVPHWFCPLPWKVSDCEIDLRPGGIFRTTMVSPEGQSFPNLGTYLEVIPNERLVWTDALLPGYRPTAKVVEHLSFSFTGIISLESVGSQTRYKATVLHSNEADRKKHEDMGFEAGWGIALDQLVAYVKKL
jgi:uncharacterized protein YndB with AHSA1/START domain